MARLSHAYQGTCDQISTSSCNSVTFGTCHPDDPHGSHRRPLQRVHRLATPRRHGAGGWTDTGDHTPRQRPQRSAICAEDRGSAATDTVSCRSSTGVLHAKKAQTSRAEQSMRPTSPSVASGVSAQLVPDREIPTSCTGWWPHPHACTPNPRKRSNPLDTQLVAHPDVGGAGRVPVRCDDTLTFVAGPGDSRSEVFWGTVVGGRYRLAQRLHAGE